jgi:hypothetical protein
METIGSQLCNQHGDAISTGPLMPLSTGEQFALDDMCGPANAAGSVAKTLPAAY